MTETSTCTAQTPAKLSWTDWKGVLTRTFREISSDEIGVRAAALGFYSMLSFVPLLAAAISLFALVTDPQVFISQIKSFAGLFPTAASDIIVAQAENLAAMSGSETSLRLAGSLLLSIWSASKAMKQLIVATNRVYDEKEERGFVKLQSQALLFTAGFLFILGFTIATLVALPLVLNVLQLGGVVEGAIVLSKWIALAVAITLCLALLNRYAPDRAKAEWRWVSVGAVVTTVLWLTVTAGFSLYVANFGSYQDTYGSLGGGVVLMLWFYLSAFIILLGSELNSEIEHQTTIDSTIGADQPMGHRGAVKADQVPAQKKAAT